MGGRAARSVVTVFVALLVAVLAYFPVAGGEARGQDAATGSVAQDKKVEEFRRWLGKTNADDFRKFDQRKVLQRALKKVPRVGPHLIKGGLFSTAAVEIWNYNTQLVLNAAVLDGTTVQMAVKTQFRPAPGAITFRSYNDDRVETVGVVTRVEWDARGGDLARYRMDGQMFVNSWRAVNRWNCEYVNGVFKSGWRGDAYSGSWGGVDMGSMSKSYGSGSQCYQDPAALPSHTEPFAYTYDQSISYYKGWYRKPQAVLWTYRYYSDGRKTQYEEHRVGDPFPLVPGSHVVMTPDVYEVNAPELLPEYQQQPGELAMTPEETTAVIEAASSDPEYKPPKPWLFEDFRVPSDPREREALWGPAVETWVGISDGQCKRYEYGAEVCDYPDGTVHVAILKDWREWEELPNATKRWLSDPKAAPVPEAERDIKTATAPRRDDECAKIGDWGPAKPGGADPDRQWKAWTYQFQVTNVSPVWGFYVHNDPDRVEFDGCRDGVLLEAKGPGYAKLWSAPWIKPERKEENKSSIVTQGRSQQGAASLVGRPPLQWHFADKDAATTVKDTSVDPPRGWFPEATPPVDHPDVLHTAPFWQ